MQIWAAVRPSTFTASKWMPASMKRSVISSTTTMSTWASARRAVWSCKSTEQCVSKRFLYSRLVMVIQFLVFIDESNWEQHWTLYIMAASKILKSIAASPYAIFRKWLISTENENPTGFSKWPIRFPFAIKNQINYQINSQINWHATTKFQSKWFLVLWLFDIWFDLIRYLI